MGIPKGYKEVAYTTYPKFWNGVCGAVLCAGGILQGWLGLFWQGDMNSIPNRLRWALLIGSLFAMGLVVIGAALISNALTESKTEYRLVRKGD